MPRRPRQPDAGCYWLRVPPPDAAAQRWLGGAVRQALRRLDALESELLRLSLSTPRPDAAGPGRARATVGAGAEERRPQLELRARSRAMLREVHEMLTDARGRVAPAAPRGGLASCRGAEHGAEGASLAAPATGAAASGEAVGACGQLQDLGRAPDQSSRYADLTLTEDDMIRECQHVLVSHIMKPKPGYDYLSTAAHFAAESSHGMNVNVCTTDDDTRSVDAFAYCIDPENEEMKLHARSRCSIATPPMDAPGCPLSWRPPSAATSAWATCASAKSMASTSRNRACGASMAHLAASLTCWLCHGAWAAPEPSSRLAAALSDTRMAPNRARPPAGKAKKHVSSGQLAHTEI
mmetsp:Transcript_109996/g.341233  ORF Transcript_109996/g.341233 Transcript_109996/m.341233 type:complete len:351 (+) Transcript_109996:110-1162(+)